MVLDAAGRHALRWDEIGFVKVFRDEEPWTAFIMPNLLQLAWMLGSTLATVLLPATNEHLPCSTRPW